MDLPRETPYDVSQFAELSKKPRSFFGYTTSIEEAQEIVRLYEESSSARYVAYVQSSGFGIPIEEAIKHPHRIRFRDIASRETTSLIPLTGVPFMLLGKQRKMCQFGRDPRKRPPREIKIRNTTSKKIGCTSMVVIRDVLVFLEHRLHDVKESNSVKLSISDKIKAELHHGIIRGERRIYIDLPDPSLHVGHIPGQEKRGKKKKSADEQNINKTGMDLTFLGTASCYPTPKRGVCSSILRHEGSYWMFDCGEGTQTQLMKSQLKASRINKIFITHLHGDHLFGLPGLMCCISQGVEEKKKKMVEIYGPSGLRKYVRVNLDLSRTTLNYKYVVHELLPVQDLPDDWETWHPMHQADGELHPNEVLGRDIDFDEAGCWQVYEDKKIMVKAAPLTHRIPCFGYVIHEKEHPGRLKTTFLRDKGISPGPIYGQLKAGEDIVLADGEVITAADAVGPPTPGRKIVILGDTRDSSRITHLAMDADVLVHEATLSNEQEEKCLAFGHSTPAMAANFAKTINTKSLVLYHVSQRYKGLSEKVEEGEQSVELLLKQASETDFSGMVAVAEDLDIITIQKRDPIK